MPARSELDELAIRRANGLMKFIYHFAPTRPVITGLPLRCHFPEVWLSTAPTIMMICPLITIYCSGSNWWKASTDAVELSGQINTCRNYWTFTPADIWFIETACGSGEVEVALNIW